MKFCNKGRLGHGMLHIVGESKITGKKTVLFHDHNIIVEGFYENVCRLLGGDAAFTGVDYIQFGTGTDAEDQAQTGLIIPVIPQIDVVVDYPSEADLHTLVGLYNCIGVEFTATLDSDEANGFNLSEVGLFTDGTPNTMVARRLWGPFNKTSDWVVHCTWTIYFDLNP